MSFDVVIRISDADVRRLVREEREIETYLGLQRPLNEKRAAEIGAYTNFQDASFPGSIILAIDEDYAEFDPDTGEVVIRNYKVGEEKPSKMMREIAHVLDGQHRIAGLKYLKKGPFDVIVTLFIGADISDQAYIFATVNLEQRKVNRSLAYDLFALAKTRSPERTCHNIAVAFDRDTSSPFYKKIKRLGRATPGRDDETITQATFVSGLLQHVSKTPKIDRDLILRGKKIPRPTTAQLRETPLRLWFSEDRDLELARIYDNFFRAVRDRWPDAWSSKGLGYMLNRTNGYRALSRFFRNAYLYHSDGTDIVSEIKFLELLKKVDLTSDDFNVSRFPPGTSGESELYKKLVGDTRADFTLPL